MSVARSRLIQRFGRDWMIYALFHCGVEYLISQNSGFWDSLQLTRGAPPYLIESFSEGPRGRLFSSSKEAVETFEVSVFIRQR